MGDGRRDLCAEPFSRNDNAARERRIQFFGAKPTVSGPPTDGQPGRKRLEMRRPATRDGSAALRAHEERTVASPNHSAARTTCLANWGPTLEMSGSLKRAKRALGCPLDRRVRCLRRVHVAFWQPKRSDATLRGRTRRRLHRALTSALRYSAGPRAAPSIEFLHGAVTWTCNALQTARRHYRRALRLRRSDGTARRRGTDLNCIQRATRPK